MKIFISICMMTAMLYSCGKSNSVDSNTTSNSNELSGNSTYEVLNQFEGTYDLINMRSDDCGASIRLVKECDGLKLLSNNLGPEEFCHINQGEIFTSNSRDNNRDNRSSTNTTLEGNVLKSVATISNSNGRITNGPVNNPGNRPIENEISYTNTLTLNKDGVLIKISNLKSRQSRCAYQKR